MKMLSNFLEGLINLLDPINIFVLIIIAVFWISQSFNLKKKIRKLQGKNKSLEREKKLLKERNDYLETRIDKNLEAENRRLEADNKKLSEVNAILNGLANEDEVNKYYKKKDK